MTKITIINCIIAVCLIDGFVARQTELLTFAPCINVYNNIKDAIEQVKNVFYTYITNQTNTAENEEFINTMNNLLTNITKNFDNIVNCDIQNPFLCITNVSGFLSWLALTSRERFSEKPRKCSLRDRKFTGYLIDIDGNYRAAEEFYCQLLLLSYAPLFESGNTIHECFA
ncbi:PREDICTED: uncharacterized protein LOC105627006 [Atta cephalotes]|uniref:Uncharacterized protein n=1 Tax=Atta cephalotes TaxID=12957 RepID=A0A158P1M0_ATTCE|nr:PREDICTED: uncharacterized protein LOC105627006 [Atta cephalotes]